MRSLLPIVVLALVLPAARAQAAPPSASGVLAGVQTYYAQAPALTAKFRQEVTNVTAGRTDRSDGTLAIKQPGKMRWGYLGKKRGGKVTRPRDFISNGKMAYLVDYDSKQIVVHDLAASALPVAVAFVAGTVDLAKEFTPTLVTTSGYGSAGDLVLELVPRQPSAQYQTLYLVVAPGDFHVRESIIVDASKNLNHFHFYEPTVRPTLPDARFELNPKARAFANFRVIVPAATPAQPVPAPTQPATSPSATPMPTR